MKSSVICPRVQPCGDINESVIGALVLNEPPGCKKLYNTHTSGFDSHDCMLLFWLLVVSMHCSHASLSWMPHAINGFRYRFDTNHCYSECVFCLKTVKSCVALNHGADLQVNYGIMSVAFELRLDLLVPNDQLFNALSFSQLFGSACQTAAWRANQP